jgi:hypothetical protein
MGGQATVHLAILTRRTGVMGRQTIDVGPHIERLVQATLLGASFAMAAKFAGISPKTFQRWRRQAEHARAGSALAQLRDRLSEAEGRAAVSWLARIEQAATAGDWRAAAWKLERKWPEAYGVHAKVDLTVDIRRIAKRVADELGVEVDALLKEAQALLDEADRDPGA